MYFFELPFLRFFKGTGFYVKHERLKTVILKAIDQEFNHKNIEDESLALKKLKRYKVSISKMSERSFFMTVWFSLSPDKLREHCQRRWEEYYIAWGINTAMILSLIISRIVVYHYSIIGKYLKENVLVGILYVLIIILLSINAKRRIAEVAEIENGWICFVETYVSSNIVGILDSIPFKC